MRIQFLVTMKPARNSMARQQAKENPTLKDEEAISVANENGTRNKQTNEMRRKMKCVFEALDV